ncbi:hypothetical protein DFQ26_009262 [Actinomortierella ambigua]|nr:hypothetical protein DFQ26_009262 [Actinomortierella ambigua]
MRRAFSFFTTVLLVILVLAHAVLAKLPVTGMYRIVSVGFRDRAVRPTLVPGEPLFLAPEGIFKGEIWHLFQRNNTYTIRTLWNLYYAYSNSTFVTLEQTPTAYRLRSVGPNVFEIVNRGAGRRSVWTVDADAKITLRRRNGSDAQKFTLVNA